MMQGTRDIGVRTHARGRPIGAGLLVAAAMLVACALVLVGWVGFLASDDALYSGAAEGWLARGMAYLPLDHWSVRHPVVLPIVASYAFLGRNEFSIALPTLLYWLALVGITAWQLHRRLPMTVVLATLAVLVSAPLMVVWASIASADIAETFFVALSLWVFLGAPAKSPRRMLLAGVLCAFAFLSRDTAVALVLFYAGCFALGLFGPRRDLFWVGVGAAAIVALEMAWYAVAAGDPLHRMSIALNHDSTVDRSVELAGNLLVSRAVDPLLMLLANQEFALICVLGLPAVAWCLVAAFRGRRWRSRDPATVFAAYALAWMVFFYAASSLLPLNPRYAMSAVYAMIVALAFAANDVRRAAGGMVMWAAAALLVLANAAALLVENRATTYGEKVLAEQVAQRAEKIHTDRQTAYRAQVRLEWIDRVEAVSVEAPPAGALYLRNPWRSSAWPATARLQAGAAAPTGWEVVAVYDPPARPLAAPLQALGMDRHVPAPIASRLFKPNAPVVLYRVR